MDFICYNGQFLPAAQPVLTAQNRSFRYGDGLFETIKVVNGRLPMAALHFDRLYTSMQLLQLSGDGFTTKEMEDIILKLCRKNNCSALARVRLAVFRGEKNKSEYIIEATPLQPEYVQWNEKGWNLDLYPLARKSCDAFANLKSANYLPYVLAGLYAAEKGADETLVLNTFNNICDGSKTNVFLIKENEIFTPALHQGCVNGVMRKLVIDSLKKKEYVVHQAEITQDMLLQADEVFCTNALQGIKWVQSFGVRQYSQGLTYQIFKLLQPAIMA